jgi:hypothetical protein
MRSLRLILPVTVVIVLLAAGACCSKKTKHHAAYDPSEQFPEWAYDAPFYYRPASPLGDIAETVPPAGPGCPTEYFTRDRIIYLQRPPGPPVTTAPGHDPKTRFTPSELAPRYAVYWTDSSGQMWNRAGYFGLCQTHFAFQVENDGTYGFRFVGPSLPEAKYVPPAPSVVYHVDTTPPEVVVTIEPNQQQYRVDEQVKVSWTVTDLNLTAKPVIVSVCWGPSASGVSTWSTPERNLPPEGTLQFVIPPDAAGQGFKVRVEARDRAGNLGVGFSEALSVAAESETTGPAAPATTQATSRPAASDTESEPAQEGAPTEETSEQSPDKTPQVSRSGGAGAERANWSLPSMPPPSTERIAASRHWTARPWQSLSTVTTAYSASVWSLPVPRLPIVDLHVAKDGP